MALEAIERTAAKQRFIDLCFAKDGIERVIPRERRQWHMHADEPEPPADCADDPRWLESEKAIFAALDAIDEEALGLLDIEPTTIEGVAAILTFVYECDKVGDDWPPIENEEHPAGMAWSFLAILSRNMANALVRIAA